MKVLPEWPNKMVLSINQFPKKKEKDLNILRGGEVTKGRKIQRARNTFERKAANALIKWGGARPGKNPVSQRLDML